MKIQKVLSVLTPRELAAFDDYLDYCVGKSSPIYTYYKKCIFPTIDLSSDSMKKKIEAYKKKVGWNDAKVRTTNHVIINYAWEYIASIEMNNNKKLKLLLTHDLLVNRNETELASKIYEQSIRMLDSGDYNTTEDLAIKFLFQKSKMRHKKPTNSYVDIFNDHFSLHQTIGELVTHEEKIRNYQLELHRLYDPTRKFPKQNINIEAPAIKLYEELSNIIHGRYFEKSYDRIIQIIEEQDNIPEHIVINTLSDCANYCIICIHNGDRGYYKHCFNCYKQMLDWQMSIITEAVYRNITLIACQVQEYGWALNFVEKYKNELPDKMQQSAYSYCKALVQWNSRDFDGVISTLRNVEYENINYKLQTRAYLLTCYYELNEYEVLDSSIKAFKVFLRRRRNIPKARKEYYYAFLTVLDHLMKSRDKDDQKRLQKAKEELDSNPSIPFQDWLREKIAEVEQQIK